MRKFLVILSFMIMSLCSTAQSCNYMQFQRSNDGCYGCSSFYWGIDYIAVINGVYFFDVCFYSNSFDYIGNWKSTYVYGLKTYVDGYLQSQVDWISFSDKFCPERMIIYSNNMYPKMFITWEGHKTL